MRVRRHRQRAASRGNQLPEGQFLRQRQRRRASRDWDGGMPNERFWDFENGTFDFGDIKPDFRDLARCR